MKNTLIILLFLAVLVASFFLGRHTKGETEILKRDTVTITKIDTLRITEFKVKKVRILDTIFVALKDTITLNDTTFIQLPRTQVIYQDTSYRAVISGYLPRLDSLEVYNKNVYKTITEKSKRYGIGVIGGLGYSDQVRPFIGIGVYYKLF